MIRDYNNKDVGYILKLGSMLHKNFKFDLDIYSKCKILEIDDEVVGFVVYSVIYDRCEIIDILIDDKFRLRGYGSKLLKTVIDDAILRKCNNITLEVNKNNLPAVRLYEKHNFHVVATRKNYYKNMDAYLMLLKLEVTI